MDIDIINKKPLKQSVVINDTNINAGVLMKNQTVVHNAFYWHKVIVQNCDNLDREFVLKTITDAVHPLDLIPVFYQTQGNNAYFLVRNCGQAITQLCRQNLIVQNPTNPNKPLKISIILSFSSTNELKVNVQDNIVSVLNKRFKSATKILNLENFYKDPDLSEFCILSQPKILYFVLHLSKGLHYQSLKLCNNELKVLSPIHALWGTSLTSLDLRNNLIENLSELDNLKNMQITELFLEGNPLCDKYDEYTYIQSVKEVCPKLEKLDGVLLAQNGFPAFRRNYLCDHSNLDLVDQFIEHYFTLYDSRNRGILEGLYHKDALFSLTSCYLQGQASSATAQLKRYMTISRNLKSLADVSRANQYLYKGNSEIIKLLNTLPLTEHDPFTFTADLLYSSEKAIVLVVSGVFREPAENLLDVERMLGFSRQFVLQVCGNGEYNIINEQMHINNATTAQQLRAFKVTRVPNSNYVALPPAANAKEKSEMEEALKLITNLNLNWAKKCLEECNYDLRKSIKLFVDLYKIDKIPDEAFIG